MIRTPAQATLKLATITSKISPFFNEILTNGTVIWGDNARGLLLRLLLELKAKYNLKSSDKVGFASFTCGSVPQAIIQSGLRPISYKICPNKLCPYLESIREVSDKELKVIILQNLFGLDYYRDDIISFCREKGIILIDDRSQGCFDPNVINPKIDFVLYSFGRGKLISAHGGAALVINNSGIILDDYAKRNFLTYLFKILMANLFSIPLLFKLIDSLFLKNRGDEFSVIHPKVISKINKQFVLRSLDWSRSLHRHRRKIAKVYSKELPESVLVESWNSQLTTYLKFPIFIEKASDFHDRFRDCGVRMSYKEILIGPVTKISNVPDSKLTEKLITLPTHDGISVTDAKKIVKLVWKHCDV